MSSTCGSVQSTQLSTNRSILFSSPEKNLVPSASRGQWINSNPILAGVPKGFNMHQEQLWRSLFLMHTPMSHQEQYHDAVYSVHDLRKDTSFHTLYHWLYCIHNSNSDGCRTNFSSKGQESQHCLAQIHTLCMQYIPR
jgi:hypothetical protein